MRRLANRHLFTAILTPALEKSYVQSVLASRTFSVFEHRVAPLTHCRRSTSTGAVHTFMCIPVFQIRSIPEEMEIG